jgi:tellurite resistance protein
MSRPLVAPRMGLWRRMPPALFPPLMGLFGLGLGWRMAAQNWSIPAGFGDAILGAVTLLYLFCGGAYLAKILVRPTALIEDARILPGRAGLAAFSLCMMLTAAVLAPFAPGLATGVALLAFGLHVALVVLVVVLLRQAPPEGRVVTPVFHLVFVGFIIGGVAANALDRPDLAELLFWAMIAPAIAIWGASARQFAFQIPPAPLRPLLAIHLAPASLLSIVGQGAGIAQAGLIFGLWALAILTSLLVAGRWIASAGFSPLWGAFTFPLAACATAMLGLGAQVPAFGLLGLGLLLAATGLIPWIAFRILKLWPDGTLAARTNASSV